MRLSDFISIANYGNTNWNGKFSQQEVKAYAKDLYADFLFSKENNCVATSIETLCNNLAEDLRNVPTAAEPSKWLCTIKEELNIIK